MAKYHTPKRRLKSFRLPEVTARRLHYLADALQKSQTEVVTLAVDQMFYQDQTTDAPARAAAARVAVPAPDETGETE